MGTALKVRVEELERVKARIQATLEQYKDGLTAEKTLEVDALMAKAQELKTEIETERKLDEKKASLADIDRFLSEPVNRLQHGVNGDDDDQKALRAMGWELKGGGWYAPTSTGDSVAMYPQRVLSGDIPTDDEAAARYFRSTRATFDPVYREAYSKHLRMAAKSGSGPAFSMLAPSEQKALAEGSDVSGGFLVPPDVMSEVLVRLPQFSIMRKYARVQTTSRDILKWPAVAPHGTSGSIYSSGFVGDWVGETPAFNDTDPGFQTFEVPIKKLRVATKLSNDLVADSAANLLSFMAQNGSENMGLVEDKGFFTGDGAALQPLGLLNSGITGVDVEGTTSDTITNTTSAAGSSPKLVSLTYTLPSQYVKNAVFVMRRSVEGSIRKLVDFQGRFLWPPYAGSQFAGTPRDLMGYPIDNSEFMPAEGTNGNYVLLFGDLSNYIIGQRMQVSSIVLRERFADTDQVGIILFERVGGACWNTDALRAGQV